MIAMLQGQVQHLLAPTAVVMTASGLGYEVELPLNAFCQLQFGQPVTLWTQLVIREDAQLLFGFLTYNDREVFRLLLKVNGVGAKMALAMMSTLSVSELAQHVKNGNEAALTRIPGVGKKTAQRLIVELTDKLDAVGASLNHELAFLAGEQVDAAADSSNEAVIIAEVEAALVALGYRDKEAQAAIKHAKTAHETPLTTQGLLKAALKSLAV